MSTSAQALQKLFTQISGTTATDKSFLSVAASTLGLEGEDSQANAAVVVLRLISEVERDISLLEKEDGSLKILRSKLARFNGVRNFSQLHLDLKSAKANFLSAENLLGLSEIHFALEGRIYRTEIDRSGAKELAQKFRDIAEDIAEADLPGELQTVLVARSMKMAAILDHYYAFGSKELRSELEGLIGAIRLAAPKSTLKSKGVFKTIAGLTVAGLSILAAADKGLESVISIGENANFLIEQFSEGDNE